MGLLEQTSACCKVVILYTNQKANKIIICLDVDFKAEYHCIQRGFCMLIILRQNKTAM